MGNESKVETLASENTTHRSRLEIANRNRRVVHVAVPVDTFNHAKAQPYLSGLSWTKFVERLLAEAKPFS